MTPPRDSFLSVIALCLTMRRMLSQEFRVMLKIGAVIIAFGASLALSGVAQAMGGCEGHQSASQQIVQVPGDQTPMTPKPSTGSGG